MAKLRSDVLTSEFRHLIRQCFMAGLTKRQISLLMHDVLSDEYTAFGEFLDAKSDGMRECSFMNLATCQFLGRYRAERSRRARRVRNHKLQSPSLF